MKPFYSHYCDTRSRNAPPSASGRVLHTPPVRSHAPTLRVPVRAFLPERVPPRRGSQSPPAREITHEAAVCAWREVDRREDRSERRRRSCTCSLRLRRLASPRGVQRLLALPQQNAHVVERFHATRRTVYHHQFAVQDETVGERCRRRVGSENPRDDWLQRRKTLE